MAQMIQRFERNKVGRDFAVGDIHGHFTRLNAALDAVGFDPAKGDRLFSVGDLVDRGPECEKAIDWLAEPWFHAVRGNHEDIAIRYAKGNPVDRAIYSRNGGDWFMALRSLTQKRFGAAFDDLPYAIEVETEGGIVGIVHANVPTSDWQFLGEELLFNRYARDRVMWDRGRIEAGDESEVVNIRAVVVGHTPLKHVIQLGNVIHIDTGGWHLEGHFTLLNLSTLETA
uniref:metallophosphoesterase n=1 Tax=Castellaniella defragrans TaxID=75697 RepID=UPI003342B519